MELSELKCILEKKLQNNLSSKIFLDRMRVFDEESRNSPQYNDPRYIPFFYYLGELIKPRSVVEIGFQLGFFTGNLVKSCKSIETILEFQEKRDEHWPMRLSRSNVRDNFKGELFIHYGEIYDEEFQKLINKKYDLALINEEVSYDKHRDYLDILWDNLNKDGLIVMNYLNKHAPAEEAYKDFCKIKNRELLIINSRYDSGIIRK